MTAFNPIQFTRRLESVGFKRAQAEALAEGYRDAMQSHVTDEQLKAALDRQTIRICGFLGTIFALGFTALGLIVSL